MTELSVDDLIQVFVPENGGSAPREQGPGRRHVALVKEVRGDQVVLKLATRADEPVPMRTGLVVLIQKPATSGVLMYRAVVTAVAMQGSPSIAIRITPGEEVQRRDFFRVPMDLRVRYCHADDRRDWFPGTLRDLSETGACLVIRERLEPGDHIILELPGEQQAFRVTGVVRRCWVEKGLGTGGSAMGVAFSDNQESQRDKIRRIVFERQLKMCRNEA